MTGSSLAAVVLAAGGGQRLHPLTRHRPKALCPVGNVALVDHAIARATAVLDLDAGASAVPEHVAVNVHHGRAAMEAHLAGQVHVSVESPIALGTAGAIGALRPWLDGRSVVVANADAWLQLASAEPGEATPAGSDRQRRALAALVEGWDGERVRLLVVSDARRGDFGPYRFAGLSVLPWSLARSLDPQPRGLYEAVWRAEHAAGRVELVEWPGAFIDCGTVADYLAANLAWSGGASVVAPDATVHGSLDRCVVWPGAEVGAGEVLRCAVRGPGWTVLSR